MATELPKTLNLEIVTPDRRLFEGEVDMVTVPGKEGYLGILPGHHPLLSELKIGIISFRQAEREVRYYCSWGFVEVLPDRVSILAEEALGPDQIDPEQARSDKKEAELLLQSKDPSTDFLKAVELYESAVTRLDVAGVH